MSRFKADDIAIEGNNLTTVPGQTTIIISPDGTNNGINIDDNGITIDNNGNTVTLPDSEGTFVLANSQGNLVSPVLDGSLSLPTSYFLAEEFHLYNGSSTILVGTNTTNRTINLPDADGTVVLADSGSGTVVAPGQGIRFGGYWDSSLNLGLVTAQRAWDMPDASGTVLVVDGGTLQATGTLYFTNLSLANFDCSVALDATTNVGTSGSFEVQGEFSLNNSGSKTILENSATSPQTITFPDADGTVVVAEGNYGIQHAILTAYRETTDDTANQVLFLDGSSLRIIIPPKTTFVFTVHLSAYSVTDDVGAWWIIRGGIRRDAADNTTLIGSLIEENDAEATLSTATATVVADDTNEALEVRVTGIAAKTIRWTATIDITKTSG